MKKNVFGLLGLLGALIFASCTNPMIASGSEDEETASTPEVQVVAAPETYVVGQSSSLIATVTGTGKGKVGYQWYKVTGSGETEKVEAINGATEYKYTSEELAAGKYVYYVTVSNTLKKSIKTADSARVEVTVTEAVKAQAPSIILAQDKNVYSKGGTVTLTATASVSDGGTLSYVWYKDGKAIEGANAATYAWENADDGTYTFKVEVTNKINAGAANESTSTNSAELSVTISEEAPFDAETPKFKYALAYTEYKLNAKTVAALDGTATVKDNGIISYAWYEVSEDGKETAINCTKAKYTPSVETVGQKTYKVVATNTNKNATGKTTAESNMSVLILVYDDSKENAKAPVITSQPAGAEYFENDEAVALTVTAKIADGEDSEKNTLTYQWYKNGVAFGDESETATTLKPSTKEIGSAVYFVRVWNTLDDEDEEVGLAKVYKDSDKVTVTVKEYTAPEPVITEQPKSNTYILIEDEELEIKKLSVTATGTGKLTYQWYKVDADGNKTEISAADKKSYSGVMSLSEIGEYTYCVEVTNTETKDGKDYSTSVWSLPATITITDEDIIIVKEPVINIKAGDRSYVQGGSVTIEAEVSGTDSDAKLEYAWYKGTDIVGTERSLTVNGTAVGTISYIFKATATRTVSGKSASKDASSEAITITVTRLTADEPVIPELEDAEYDEGAAIEPLSAHATASTNVPGATSTLKYQWYQNDNNSNTDGTEIAGATDSTYTPVIATSASASTAVTVYYYVKVTNVVKNGEITAENSKTSNAAKITINPASHYYAAKPVFSKPVTAQVTCNVGAAAQTIKAEATAGGSGKALSGNITYQWYKADAANKTGTAFGNAGDSLTPDTSAAGTSYYYCIAINTIPETDEHYADADPKSATSDKSDIITVVVSATPDKKAKKPIASLSASATTYTIGGTGAKPVLTVTVTYADTDDGEVGTLTYTWYKVSGTTYTEITGYVDCDKTTYTVDETTAGNYAYAVEVKNAVTGATIQTSEKASSNEITIEAGTGTGGFTIDFGN